MGQLLIAGVLAAAAIQSTLVSAQVRGGGFVDPFSTPQTVTPGFANFGIPRPPVLPAVMHPRPLIAAPIFLYSDFLYSDWGYAPVAPQPVSVIVVQPPALPPRAEDQHPPAEPLVLELQGERWARVDTHLAKSTPVPSNREEKRRIHNACPIILIFRDGRAEQASAYAIIGDTLYEQTDYWTTGAWTKKIALADLDVPATISANQKRGANFRLPAGLNEVVLQP